MNITNAARTGFDLECIVSHRLLARVAQLLLDAGVLPSFFEVPNPLDEDQFLQMQINAQTDEQVPRTYTAAPGFSYAETNENAFDAGFTTYPDEPDLADFVYIQFRAIANAGSQLTLDLNIYARIHRELDIQALARDLRDFDAQDPDSGPALDELFHVESILDQTAAFDPLDPTAGMLFPLVPVLEELNAAIAAAGQTLAESDDEVSAAIRDALLAQLDPLNGMRLDVLHLNTLEGSDKLALAANLVLLDHEVGFVAPRGDLSQFVDFLGDEQDIAFATGPGFLENVLADALHKMMLAPAVEAEELDENDLQGIFLGMRFPMAIPPEVISEFLGTAAPEEDDPEPLVTGYLKALIVSSIARTFPGDEDGPEFDCLRIELQLDAYLADLFGIGSGNLFLDVFPLTAERDGLPVSDLTVATNARADLWRGLLSITGFPLTVIGAVVDLFSDADEQIIPLSELLELPLVDIVVARKRWEPFYLTLHTLLLEALDQTIELNRFGFAARIHLSKRFEGYPNVYLREAQLGGEILSQLLFRAERASEEIPAALHYASDSEFYTHLEDDAESEIYQLPAGDSSGSPAQRIPQGKFYTGKRYRPQCITMDAQDEYIARIGLFSEEEERDLRRRLEHEYLRDWANELVADLESGLGRPFEEDVGDAIYDQLYTLMESSSEFEKYRALDLDDDFNERLLEPGVLRLALSPEHLHGLIMEQVVILLGYEPVVREGKLYYRGEADETTENNLLSLPACPVAMAPG
ncbi:hypothetical protein E4634_03245 [Mangrovimicrobium sediminis]|uniref:Uncharacterized protein n=1 Tax=Mangrovimicrobium sediminis TaxID=2562682 RepID=A0A4Z0M840_9GAMM|nr:hypothetical protein [Haliea sp. SAOS-164]TGD75475.1 hypothetical protein E4634_03245 [Haliea sp. SAOS-164]